MAGIPGHNAPAFNDATRELVKRGYECYNPADIGQQPGWSWADYMKVCLRNLLDCDGVAFLPGWHDSRGSLLEMSVAADLGIPRKYYKDWI